MFIWSRTDAAHSEGSGKLVLPHIRDVRDGYHSVGTEEGETMRVTCLDISPAAGVLVTGCEDGVASVDFQ